MNPPVLSVLPYFVVFGGGVIKMPENSVKSSIMAEVDSLCYTQNIFMCMRLKGEWRLS